MKPHLWFSALRGKWCCCARDDVAHAKRRGGFWVADTFREAYAYWLAENPSLRRPL